jgi:hypothetical protein
MRAKNTIIIPTPPTSKTGVILTKKQPKNKVKSQYLQGIDWLQICFKFIAEKRWLKSEYFEIKKEEGRTQHFGVITNVFYKGINCFNICSHPISNILPPDMLLLKVINEFLYREDWMKILELFQEEQNLKFNNLTRFDLYLDFNNFESFNSPEILIHKFVSDKVIKSNKGKFKIMGNNLNKMQFEYLRFGQGTSEISTYLYNKSKELQEVKNKPYIIDSWLRGGLNISNDIWRLEFSIKVPNLTLCSEDGELLATINHYNELTPENINLMLLYYINTNFKFYYNDGQARKDRNRHVILFPYNFEKIKRLRSYSMLDSSRSDKIFINKILKNDAELRAKKPTLANDLNLIVDYFAASKGLSKYLRTKRHILGVDRVPIKLGGLSEEELRQLDIEE